MLKMPKFFYLFFIVYLRYKLKNKYITCTYKYTLLSVETLEVLLIFYKL